MLFKLGELFCGPGGLARAALDARITVKEKVYGITPIWANDYDQDTCETYKKNICPDNPENVICRDVRKLDYNQLKKIDALAFGFPCNDFSIVGEQRGINGKYGPLYTYGLKAINYFKPIWFLAENVGGLKHSNEGKAFDKILLDFFNAGYDLYPHLYKFELYGVPQTRHRIIIIGIRKDQNVRLKIPGITTNKPITCKEALTGVESIPYNNEYTKQSNAVIERLKYIKPGENAFTASIPERLRLNVRSATISQIYKRLHPLKPAYTITGSGGGGTHVYHWTENRALTNRERARLQTFPDNFIFYGSKESVRKQIGMAVPPKGARVIFEAILKSFAGVAYNSASPNIPPMLHNKAIQFDLLKASEKKNAYYSKKRRTRNK